MNFRKASIFQRDTEKPEEQNDSGGMLAVWGSPGSGKTITAVKIAKMLSARKKNVILLLCDMAAPMLPCICPADALESNGSLAGVLAAARISENLIKHNLVTFKRNSCLAVLGLLERQNEYSTPPFTQKQVVELLDGLRQIAPYVIVDCGSYIANDILSAVALMEADSILRLANCDPKSVNYFASQLPLLDGPEWDMDKQYKVASNVKPYQAADHIGKVLGDTAFVLPYYAVGGQLCRYPKFVPEDYVLLKLTPCDYEDNWYRWNQEIPPGSPKELVQAAKEFSGLKIGYRGDLTFRNAEVIDVALFLTEEIVQGESVQTTSELQELLFEHIEREQREYTDSLYRMTQGQLIANAGEIEATRICYNALLTAVFEREQLILLLSNDKPLTSVREAWQAEQAENYDMEFSHTILRFCEDIRQAQQPEMTM